jgi:hypothetical protein
MKKYFTETTREGEQKKKKRIKIIAQIENFKKNLKKNPKKKKKKEFRLSLKLKISRRT